ncbi:hypothetical protein AN958_03030 [Leucoagaricus sp. SymC.cos]|nr:hypothetical protein AN958_03030 [Leucoagaricus sp. SymC.cos]
MPHADASLIPSSIKTKPEFWEHVYMQLEGLLEEEGNWVNLKPLVCGFPSFTNGHQITNCANAASLIYNSLLAFPAYFGNKAVNWCAAYFTQDSLENLRTIDDLPELASLHVPPGKYLSARSVNKNPKISPYPHPVGSLSGQSRLFQTRPPLWICDSNGEHRGALAPLAYLEKIAPLRRHPMDEKALMSFSCHVTRRSVY